MLRVGSGGRCSRRRASREHELHAQRVPRRGGASIYAISSGSKTFQSVTLTDARRQDRSGIEARSSEVLGAIARDTKYMTNAAVNERSSSRPRGHVRPERRPFDLSTLFLYWDD
jgi:hypothetical protein